MTVSLALNTPKLVKAATIDKVMEAVRITGYIPNLLAGGLASRRNKFIAVVVPQINNAMFVDTIQAISDELDARGYHMLLCVAGYSDETEAEIVATLLSRRPDGVVLTGIHHTPELRKIILNAQIPVVEIWDLTPTPLDILIGFSHEKIGFAAGDYLLGKGHRRFGLIWAADRRAAQQLAVMGFGDLAFAAHNVPSISTFGVYSWKMGKEAATLLADKIEGKSTESPIIDIGFTLIERDSA